MLLILGLRGNIRPQARRRYGGPARGRIWTRDATASRKGIGMDEVSLERGDHARRQTLNGRAGARARRARPACGWGIRRSCQVGFGMVAAAFPHAPS